MTVIMVLPLCKHTTRVQVNNADDSQRQTEQVDYLLQDGPVGLDADDGGVLGVDVSGLRARHLGLVDH